MGPPLEYESISFFASSSKLNAAASPLFSGLLISELHSREREMNKLKDLEVWSLNNFKLELKFDIVVD